mmetsp:Transcript_5354/g.18193  ORF Transcript_5354/g.18193 Transcript_5354/m.18193 type:complete len:359 (+) Transcript_5354:212-1288(+)
MACSRFRDPMPQLSGSSGSCWSSFFRISRRTSSSCFRFASFASRTESSSRTMGSASSSSRVSREPPPTLDSSRFGGGAFFFFFLFLTPLAASAFLRSASRVARACSLILSNSDTAQVSSPASWPKTRPRSSLAPSSPSSPPSSRGASSSADDAVRSRTLRAVSSLARASSSSAARARSSSRFSSKTTRSTSRARSRARVRWRLMSLGPRKRQIFAALAPVDVWAMRSPIVSLPGAASTRRALASSSRPNVSAPSGSPDTVQHFTEPSADAVSRRGGSSTSRRHVTAPPWAVQRRSVSSENAGLDRRFAASAALSSGGSVGSVGASTLSRRFGGARGAASPSSPKDDRAWSRRSFRRQL